MNNLNGSPGLTSISASQRAFATKGIIPEFKECKWDYEADKDGFQEFAETFRTVIAARFPEAEIIHRHIDYHTGRQGNLAMVEKVSIPEVLLKEGISQDDDFPEPARDRQGRHAQHDQVSDQGSIQGGGTDDDERDQELHTPTGSEGSGRHPHRARRDRAAIVITDARQFATEVKDLNRLEGRLRGPGGPHHVAFGGGG